VFFGAWEKRAGMSDFSLPSDLASSSITAAPPRHAASEGRTSRAGRLSPSEPVSARGLREPREPRERRWEKITPDVRVQLKAAFQAMINPDSYWSVVTAGAVALLCSCLLLLWARPSVVLQKNTDGSVERSQLSLTRLFATSVFLAAVVVGLALYFKWRRGGGGLAAGV